MDGEVGAFREVLAQETVSVLVGAALPRIGRQSLLAAMRGAVRVAEVDVEFGGQGQAPVIGQFFAAVPG